nr:transposase (putative), gypsy type [Tanacetum cinerariifolium]
MCHGYSMRGKQRTAQTETAAPEVPPPEEVPITTVPGDDQAAPVAVELPAVQESRKRGGEGIDVNAPPKSLRRDHADLQPSGVPADVSDPDPLAFADAPSPHPADVIRVYRPEWGVTNGSLLDTPEACQDLVDHAAPPGYFSELHHMHNEDFLGQYNINLARQVAMGSQLRLRFEQEAKLLRKSVAQVDALQQQAFVDVVSAGIAKGMSEGLKHGVEHGHAQQTIESLEAYDPEAEAKFAAALQSLKDLKLPLLDQLEGLKDAPMDVIMASLYLEDDTGDDAPQFIRDLCPSSSQLAIPVYPEVRDPRNPWACTEEIKLADANAANISRAEQKKRSRIVCRTHGVGSAHHARSDRVPVSAPIVVPQGLALILVDAATQTDPDVVPPVVL